MLTSARPRTLVLVMSDVVVDVAMLGPRGHELGSRQVVPLPATPDRLWQAIDPLGEFDRITLVGTDRDGVAGQIARESQRPLRQMTHGALRWQRVVAGSGVELALTLGSRFGSTVYHDGAELPGVDLGAQLVRKRRRVREYLAPRVAETRGLATWQRRVTRAVDELLAVWNPTTLYLAPPPTLLLPALPAQVVAVPARVSLEDALSIWDTTELAVRPAPATTPTPAPAPAPTTARGAIGALLDALTRRP